MGDNKAGNYQVWHADDPRAHLAFGRAAGQPSPPFPEGYSHVANVQARSLDQVFTLTNIEVAEDVPSWHENPGVKLIANDARSTSAGDVIVDPEAQPHRIGWGGFQEIPASERPGWQTMHEVAEEERAGRAEDQRAMDRAYFGRLASPTPDGRTGRDRGR